MMEKDLEKLETLLGEKYEDWTQDTLAKILGSEEAIELFKPELVVYILLNKKNDTIVNTLLPVKYGFDIRAIKEQIEEYLVAYKEQGLSLEEYKEKVLKLKDLDNPIFKLAVYLTEIASFGEDYDMSKEEVEIRAALTDYKKILLSLRIDEGFQVIIELLDLLYPFAELYNQRYKVDLLKDDKDFTNILNSVNAKTQEMMEYIAAMEKEDERLKNDPAEELHED